MLARRSFFVLRQGRQMSLPDLPTKKPQGSGDRVPRDTAWERIVFSYSSATTSVLEPAAFPEAADCADNNR